MTTKEKMSDDEKRQPPFGFPFGGPEGVREMMKMWCQPGMKVCDCCPMANVVKEEASRRTSTE